MSVGSSVQGASRAARTKLIDLARGDSRSPLYGIAADQIMAREGRLFSRNDASKGEPFGAIIARASLKEIGGTYDTQFNDKQKTHSAHAFGAQFAKVRVDPDFGEVRITAYTGVFGIVMGIGMALMEATIMDINIGRIVNHDFAEYHVPVNADVPSIDIQLLDNFDEYASPIGAKGAGEIGIVGVAAAVANAVYHATGVRIRDLPITPDKLLGKGQLA